MDRTCAATTPKKLDAEFRLTTDKASVLVMTNPVEP